MSQLHGCNTILLGLSYSPEGEGGEDMSIDRREFLKIAGASTLLGIGGMSASAILKKNLLEASQVMPDPRGLTAKRWGMVVDISKFKREDDYRVSIDACH